MTLASRVEALSQRVFHAKLGSLRDKVARMEGLADFLVQHVPGADVVRSRRAVQLAKEPRSKDAMSAAATAVSTYLVRPMRVGRASR